MDKDLNKRLKELIKKAQLPATQACEDDIEVPSDILEPINKDFDDETKERFLKDKLKLENEKLELENQNLAQSIRFRRDLTNKLQNKH